MLGNTEQLALFTERFQCKAFVNSPDEGRPQSRASPPEDKGTSRGYRALNQV
jgi:hypothetical protein